jgi:hypothetical protein
MLVVLLFSAISVSVVAFLFSMEEFFIGSSSSPKMTLDFPPSGD